MFVMAETAKNKPRQRRKTAAAKPANVNVALQGGGAHGAFTWGVLDRILEDGRIGFEGVSGTSAGAINAVVLADGFAEDGPDGARAALERFWYAVSVAGRASPIQRSPIDQFFGNWNLDVSPAYIAFDLMSRLVSPYELNPSTSIRFAISSRTTSISTGCGPAPSSSCSCPRPTCIPER
jgi:NTE family protein